MHTARVLKEDIMILYRAFVPNSAYTQYCFESELQNAAASMRDALKYEAEFGRDACYDKSHADWLLVCACRWESSAYAQMDVRHFDSISAKLM